MSAQRIVGLAIKVYRRCFSGLFASLGSGCRFQPTCSEYMEDAVRLRGLLRGVALGIWRLVRCHPFSAGGFDPVADSSGRR